MVAAGYGAFPISFGFCCGSPVVLLTPEEKQVGNGNVGIDKI